MKKKLLATLIVSTCFSSNAIADKVPFYIGSYSSTSAIPHNDGIKYGYINTSNDTISPLTLAAESVNPSYLLVTGDKVFAVNEMEPGTITSYTKNGSFLNFNDLTIINGNKPVFISQHNNDLFVANYGDSNSTYSGISTFNKRSSKPIMVDSLHYNEADRSHAHSIYPVMINGKYIVYSADLGTDTIHVYTYDHQKLTPIQNLKLTSGTGPRNMAISTKNNRIYVANELNSTISILNINPNTGELSVSDTIESYIDELTTNSYPSAIMLADNDSKVYVANRGLNNITLFNVKENGLLEYSNSYPSKGKSPKDMDISQNGEYLVIANQFKGGCDTNDMNDTGGIEFFRIIPNTGDLNSIGCVQVDSATTIKFSK